jgi:translation initiation factor IF-3
VFLVGAEGEQLGVKPLPEALAQARDQQFDLVEVAPNANPPVARIMDYGRYVYEQEQRRRQSKRKATKVVIKEMKFKPKIDEHDYVTKMKHVMRFLDEGNKVKLTIWLRGREIAHPELGMRILRRIAEDVGDLAMIESQPRQDGRNMTMVLHPTKKDGKKEKPERTPKPESQKADNQQAASPQATSAPAASPPAASPQAASPQAASPQAASPQAEKVSTAPAAAPVVEASVADVPPPVDNGAT